jgi:hypothetical protein
MTIKTASVRTQKFTLSLATAGLFALVGTGLASTESHAQGLSERIKAVGEQKREELAGSVTRGKLLGALLYTDVSVNFDKTPAKTAFEYVQQQMGVPLIVRYEGEGGSEGVDPELEVSLSLENAPALTVLERMLEICGVDSACTWQIREGFVEAGPKERLAVAAARELRMYPVRDLLFEPPTFDNAPDFNLSSALAQGNQQGGQGGGQGGGGGGFGGGGGGGGFGGGGGGGGAGGGGGVIGDPGEDPERPSEEDQAQQLMDIIQEQCEPEAWLGGEWASMRYYQGVLIVRAPDFVHRQIDGYPFAPVRPRRESGAVEESGARRYVTFTTGFSVVDNVKFRAVPVGGAVGGNAIGSPIVATETTPGGDKKTPPAGGEAPKSNSRK